MDRPLTENERAVIEQLLSIEFRDVEFFRAQVRAIRVTEMCPCGCGTLQFKIDQKQAERAPSPAWDDGPDVIVEGDEQSWLMLFQNGGWLAELEHVDGYGARPQELDAASIEPDLQVEEDWFDERSDDKRWQTTTQVLRLSRPSARSPARIPRSIRARLRRWRSRQL